MCFRGVSKKPYIFVFALLTLIILICGCSKAKTALVEAPPAYQPTPANPQIKLANVAAPKLLEVQDALKRVFKDAVTVEKNLNPPFFTGDFNGDSSEDLAVILKVAPGKLSEMNEEYPAWLLRDPFAKERARLNVEESDVLLAIIHGFGDNGWRDSQATQTYLLKNAVGSDIEVQTAKQFIEARTTRRLPRLQGDLIAENLHGTAGYLYYTSGNYLWYAPKTFRPTATAHMVHGK